VTNMFGIFRQDTAFNQNISAWNTSSATTMYSMFEGAEAFDQDIGEWDLSSVTDINGMFNGALSFNQDISSWDTSKVTDMSYVFYMATSFAQNIGAWNISSVTYAEGMFEECNLSYTNYNSLLNGWASQLVQPDVIFGGGYSVYTAIGRTSRDILTDTYNWTITDGGLYTPPINTYEGYGNSTNLSNVPNISAVVDFTIQTTTSLLEFNTPVDLSGTADISDEIYITDGLIVVDVVENPSLNVSASIGLDISTLTTCDGFALYYGVGLFATREDLIAGGEVVATSANIGGDCTDQSICTDVGCSGGVLTFTAQHFDGFGVGEEGGNQITGYVSQYEAGDLGKLTIDTLAKGLLEVIAFIGVIVVVGIVIYGANRFKKIGRR